MSPGTIATMSEAAAEAAVSGCCRELRLPTIRTEAASLADAAARAGLTHRAFLAGVLLAEVDERSERRRQRRLGEARFPRMKRLSDFNCSLSPVPAATVATLAAGAFIDAGTPVVLL
ncbi:MAG: ATP-binding protein, partial [Acidimicrobiales bacterium]